MADHESDAYRICRAWAEGDGPTWHDRKAAENPRNYALAFGAVLALLCSPVALAATIQGHWLLAAVLGAIAIGAGTALGVMARRHAEVVARAMELWREDHPEAIGNAPAATDSHRPPEAEPTAGAGGTGEPDGSRPIA